MTNRLAEVVEATGDEHDPVGKAGFGVPKAVFHDPDTLDPGQHMLGGDANLAHQAIMLPFLLRAFLAWLLLNRLVDHHAGGREGLKGAVLMQFTIRRKAEVAAFGQGFVVHGARGRLAQEAHFSLAEVADDHIFIRVRFFLPL